MSHFLCITEKCREQRSQETPNSALITTEKTQQSFWLDDSVLSRSIIFFSYLIKGKVRGWEKGGMVGVFSGVFIISRPYGIDPIIRLYHNKVVKIWSSSQKFSKTYEEHLEIRLF